MTCLPAAVEKFETKPSQGAAYALAHVSDRNGKMPGSSFATSPRMCHVGRKLAQVEGSVCNGCYALKIDNFRKNVADSWMQNYLKATRMIAERPDLWVKACATQITHKAIKSGEPYHRWFDAGDLDSVAMLAAICDVARATPDVAHWLPTREAGILKAYLATGATVPQNLTIRVSSTMIDDAPRAGYANTSTVHRKGSTPHGHVCPSSTPENRAYSADGSPNCGPCRACWSGAVANVSYPLH